MNEPPPRQDALWAAGAALLAGLYGAFVELWPARGLTFLWDDWSILDRVTHEPWPRSWLEPINEHWNPLYAAFFQLEHALYGSDHTLYLATTLAIHVVNVALLAWLLGRRAEDARAGAIGAAAFGLVTSYREVLWWASVGPLALAFLLVLVGFLALERARESDRRAPLVLAAAASFLAPLTISVGIVLGPALAVEAWFLAPRPRRLKLAWAVLAPSAAYLVLYASVALAQTAPHMREHAADAGSAALFAVDSVGLGVVGRTLLVDAPAGKESLVGFGLALAYAVGIAALAWVLSARERARLLLAQAYLVLAIVPVALARATLFGPAAAAWSRYQYFPALAWTTVVALGLAPLLRKRPRATLVLSLVALGLLARAHAGAARDDRRAFVPISRADHPGFVRRLVTAAREAPGPIWDADLPRLLDGKLAFPPTRARAVVELLAPDVHAAWTSAVTSESLAPYERDPLLAALVAARAR